MPKDKPSTTRPAGIQDAIGAADKADQFLQAAKTELELGRTDVATSNAVNAGILAADAICAIEKGLRSTKHAEAATLLASIPRDGKALSAQLSRLLAYKTKAQYSNTESISPSDAQKAVAGAERLVEKARTLVELKATK
jgi:uncharacterized protein (UPF0332 family)